MDRTYCACIASFALGLLAMAVPCAILSPKSSEPCRGTGPRPLPGPPCVHVASLNPGGRLPEQQVTGKFDLVEAKEIRVWSEDGHSKLTLWANKHRAGLAVNYDRFSICLTALQGRPTLRLIDIKQDLDPFVLTFDENGRPQLHLNHPQSIDIVTPDREAPAGGKEP